MKGVLITGGAGFIGSNFLRLFLQKISPQIQVINLDNLSYAGDLSNLRGIERHKNYHFIKGDICDSTLVAELFARFHIDGVIHFAAESHVDNSIASPEIFIKTNIQGTWNLLQIAYKSWLDAPFCPKKGFENALFHHISTDEVYGTLGKTGKFSETSPYAPNSPYSASKASSDMLVRSYAHTFGLNAVITNCSNNYGPNQHNEKLIPTIIRNALQNKQIPIYGDGQNVRDWLFVEDHCEAIMQVFDYAKGKIATMTGGGVAIMKTLFIAKLKAKIQAKTKTFAKIKTKIQAFAKILIAKFTAKITKKIQAKTKIQTKFSTKTKSFLNASISVATKKNTTSTSPNSFAPT